MSYETTLSSKGQLTIPARVRKELGLKQGATLDIYPTEDGFVGKIKRRSQIMQYMGDIQDDSVSISTIREKAQKMAAKELIERKSA